MFLGKLFWPLWSCFCLKIEVHAADLFHRKTVKNLTNPQENMDHSLLYSVKVLNIRVGVHPILYSVWLLLGPEITMCVFIM